MALRAALRAWPRRASASLLRVELIRSIRRSGSPAQLVAARHFLGGLDLIRLADPLMEEAANVEPATNRSLGAIHLAAALSLGSDLGVVMTYDQRMVDAATMMSIPTDSPDRRP